MVRLDLLSSPIFVIVVTASYWLWIAFEVWLVVRERGSQRNQAQDQGTRNSIIVWWTAGILVGIFAVPNLLPKLVIPGNTTVVTTLGIVVVWLGIALRYAAVRTLGRFFRSKVVIQEEHTLINQGPYKFLRNPSYTGALVTLMGFGVAVGNWLSLLVLFVVGVLSFIHRIGVEERALIETFGDAYLDYKKRTWALIPFVW